MGWGLGAGVMGLEGNPGRVKWVSNPHEFVCLGPGLKGFTPIPCAYYVYIPTKENMGGRIQIKVGKGLFYQLNGRHMSILYTSCSSKHRLGNVDSFKGSVRSKVFP